MALTLNIEKESHWETIRDLYITLTLRFKMKINDSDMDNKMFVLAPKQLEIA